MPPDLHPDLHTKQCNALIEAMQKCHKEVYILITCTPIRSIFVFQSQTIGVNSVMPKIERIHVHKLLQLVH